MIKAFLLGIWEFRSGFTTLFGMIKAFLLGIWEFRSGFTTLFANRDVAYAYDMGRELAHRLTFRRYES